MEHLALAVSAWAGMTLPGFFIIPVAVLSPGPWILPLLGTDVLSLGHYFLCITHFCFYYYISVLGLPWSFQLRIFPDPSSSGYSLILRFCPLSFQTCAGHTKALPGLGLISLCVPRFVTNISHFIDFKPGLHLTFSQNKISMVSSFQDVLSWTLSISPGFLSLYPLICVIISAGRAELLSAVGYLYFKSFSSQYLPEPFLCFLPLSPCPLKHFSSLSCAANPALLLPYLCSEICCCTHADEIICSLLKAELSKEHQQCSITQGRGPQILCKGDIKKLLLWEEGWADVWVVICSV